MKHKDHVRVKAGSMELFCVHCGATYQPGMPCPIDVYVAAGKAFSKIHKNCKAKK